ncbi:hypothetical protein SKAU_G00100810 [Synaphobranchus kaupii]|uniref:Uncharacterized protein n=1 Tax=Synaphobranchus kaupii TaxID=118154 RepID=A0A9Q1J7F3_SYNKA|nr:hypothetical protein SKAU_G00100810 [Synaphobranchus kaupii]
MTRVAGLRVDLGLAQVWLLGRHQPQSGPTAAARFHCAIDQVRAMLSAHFIVIIQSPRGADRPKRRKTRHLYSWGLSLGSKGSG